VVARFVRDEVTADQVGAAMTRVAGDTPVLAEAA
jgi:hypothetical protein